MKLNHHSRLFRLSYRLLKYFLLLLFGFALACILSMILGAPGIAALLISTFSNWLFRLASLVLILMATAIILESIRY